MAQQAAKDESAEWNVGQKCEVHCYKEQRWIKGEVIGVFKDVDGEWVKVQYARKRIEMLSDSDDIRHLRHQQQEDHGWRVGSQCELYSREQAKWIEGEVINTMDNALGRYLRVQYGQMVQDIATKHVAHDLRARGTSHLAVTLDDFQKLKAATAKRSAVGTVLKRIFANSEQFMIDDNASSFVPDQMCISIPDETQVMLILDTVFSAFLISKCRGTFSTVQ